MAYLCSWTAGVSVCGDTVHLTSFALGQSPHSTIQFSSREVTRNNTSDIENDGEREEKRGNPHCCFLWPKKEKKRKTEQKEGAEIWAEELRHAGAFTASRLPEQGGRCHTEPQNAVLGTMGPLWKATIRATIRWTDIVGKLALCVCKGLRSEGQKRAWGERVGDIIFGAHGRSTGSKAASNPFQLTEGTQ